MSDRPVIVPPSFEETTIPRLRIRLIPFLFLLYVVAFLDRTNISFASLTMNSELGITTQQFGFLSGIFFLGYSLFEVPSNLLLHKIGARVWIARILISWGAVAMLTGFLSDLLVSPAGTGSSNCAVHGGLARYKCSRCAGFRAHFGPHSLARDQQLAMAANTRGHPGCGLRRPYLFRAAKPSRRGQIPEAGGKRLDHRRTRT